MIILFKIWKLKTPSLKNKKSFLQFLFELFNVSFEIFIFWRAADDDADDVVVAAIAALV